MAKSNTDLTTSTLSQPAKMTKAAVREAEARVAAVLDATWWDSDPEIAAKFLQQGDTIEQLTALMRAELLHGLSADWARRGMRGEFYDFILRKTGKDRTYTERRVRVGAMLTDMDIPAIVRDQLKMRTMEELIMLATPWDADKLQPSSAQWQKLLAQPDPPSLGDEINRLLGRQKKTNAMTIVWKRDGTLEAWQDGVVVPIGFLKPPADDDGLLRHAVSRIVKAARLQVE